MIEIADGAGKRREELFGSIGEAVDVSAAVAEILENVRQRGDAALAAYTKSLDGADLTQFQVSQAEIEAACAAVEPELMDILRRSHENITAFHQHQKRESFLFTPEDGVVLGQKFTPIARVGLYIPGGTARYPSSVLMNAVPARLAGVKERIMVTPPNPDGSVPPVILAAAHLAGITAIYKIGGAQAIAALAYGTESIPAVDKIVGPGNAYVAEAKKQVFGRVAIDMVAGPSEILILATGGADAAILSADLLSQAEHDKNATAILITDSPRLAVAVQEELERQIPLLPRAEIARASIDSRGKILLVPNLEAGIDLANEIAPEHLELYVDNPFDYLDRIHNAGSIFLGKNCPEALGDYWAGPNHTLPTSGTARFSSPLSVDDFMKKSSFTYYNAAALGRCAPDIARFAQEEGLQGHANSALIRSNKEAKA